MPRRPTADTEVIRSTEAVIESTLDAHELRCAQAVLLPIRVGLTLSQAAEAIRRERATVGSLQAEFRADSRDRPSPSIAGAGAGGRI